MCNVTRNEEGKDCRIEMGRGNRGVCVSLLHTRSRPDNVHFGLTVKTGGRGGGLENLKGGRNGLPAAGASRKRRRKKEGIKESESWSRREKEWRGKEPRKEGRPVVLLRPSNSLAPSAVGDGGGQF